jgi:hypothetical protein
LHELEGSIAASLRQGYLRDPDVSIEIDRYRSFFIMGEVGQAGQYSYVAGMTVQNAIAIAGGFSARANQRNVDITRKINGEIMTGSVSISDPDSCRRHHLCARAAYSNRWQQLPPCGFCTVLGRRSAAFSGMSAISPRSMQRPAIRWESCAIPPPVAPMKTSCLTPSCRI